MITFVDEGRDPDDRPEPEPHIRGAILSPVGIVPVPNVLGWSPPRTEPEERWTLGRERRPQTGTADDEPDASSPGLTLEPVQRRRTGPGYARTGPR